MTSLAPGNLEEIKVVVAKEAIREKLASYCRSVDRLDHELGYSVFTEDSELDYGPSFKGTGREFIDWCIKSHLNLTATSHRISNTKIVVKADKAYSETYLFGLMRRLPAENGDVFEINVVGRYLDEWSCSGADWRIAKRQFVQDFAKMTKVDVNMGSYGSTRDNNDPSYEVFDR
jgi:hypothetical protein